MENKHTLKNDQLLNDSEFGPKLKSGKIVVLGVLPTKNAEIMTACVAQLRDDVSSNDSTSLNDIFLGWSKALPQVVRVFRTFNPEVMDLKVGDTLSANYNLQVVDSETPFYPGQEPRKRPNGGSAILRKGNPIYRNGKIVDGTPSHAIIKDYDKENASTVLAAFASAGQEFGA